MDLEIGGELEVKEAEVEMRGPSGTFSFRGKGPLTLQFRLVLVLALLGGVFASPGQGPGNPGTPGAWMPKAEPTGGNQSAGSTEANFGLAGPSSEGVGSSGTSERNDRAVVESVLGLGFSPQDLMAALNAMARAQGATEQCPEPPRARPTPARDQCPPPQPMPPPAVAVTPTVRLTQPPQPQQAQQSPPQPPQPQSQLQQPQPAQPSLPQQAPQSPPQPQDMQQAQRQLPQPFSAPPPPPQQQGELQVVPQAGGQEVHPPLRPQRRLLTARRRGAGGGEAEQPPPFPESPLVSSFAIPLPPRCPVAVDLPQESRAEVLRRLAQESAHLHGLSALLAPTEPLLALLLRAIDYWFVVAQQLCQNGRGM